MSLRLNRHLLSSVIPAAILSALLSGCAPAIHAPVPAPPGQPYGSLLERMLASRNQVRAAAQVPPVQWDPRLAAQAEAYARQLAPLGNLAHSTRELRLGQGENLWMGTAGAYQRRR